MMILTEFCNNLTRVSLKMIAIIINNLCMIEFLSTSSVLRAFQNSGASMGQIKEMGMCLSIPRDQMVVDHTTNPARLAVDVIDKWKKLDPKTTDHEYAYNKLTTVLRQCRLNNITHRLTHSTCPWNSESLMVHAIRHISVHTT